MWLQPNWLTTPYHYYHISLLKLIIKNSWTGCDLYSGPLDHQTLVLTTGPCLLGHVICFGFPFFVFILCLHSSFTFFSHTKLSVWSCTWSRTWSECWHVRSARQCSRSPTETGLSIRHMSRYSEHSKMGHSLNGHDTNPDLTWLSNNFMSPYVCEWSELNLSKIDDSNHVKFWHFPLLTRLWAWPLLDIHVHAIFM